MAVRQGTPQDDILVGTDEGDTFIGSSGNDVSTGGDGGDLFAYQKIDQLSVWTGAITDPHETITDFGYFQDNSSGFGTDILDLSQLSGFQYIGDSEFSVTGRSEYRLVRLESTFSTAKALLLFDAAGDGSPDHYLELDVQASGGYPFDPDYRPAPVLTNVLVDTDITIYHDFVGTGADEILFGHAGYSRLYGFGGNDRLYGTAGTDELYGGDGNDRLDGHGGADDFFAGGKGDDVYFVTSETNNIFEATGEGTDIVNSSAAYYFLRDNVENLSLIGDAEWGAGNGLGNIINGNSRANIIFGVGGNDTLSGAGGGDAIYGGTGNDWIRGGTGADFLVGDDGADKFVYYTTAEASGTERDTIVDFYGLASGVAASERDRIDLHRIDADAFTAGDDAFRFLGTAAFSGTAGELHIVAATIDVADPFPEYPYPGSPYQTAGYVVEGDVNGDGRADFQIAVATSTVLHAGDFYL